VRRVDGVATRIGTARERAVVVLHCVDAVRAKTPEAACVQGAIALDSGVSSALAQAARNAAPS
jgi:hypothetical protein